MVAVALGWSGVQTSTSTDSFTKGKQTLDLVWSTGALAGGSLFTEGKLVATIDQPKGKLQQAVTLLGAKMTVDQLFMGGSLPAGHPAKMTAAIKAELSTRAAEVKVIPTS